MLEDREGFIKLNEDSRRGSNFHYHPSANGSGCGLREETRLRLHFGFGRFMNLNLKVEKEDSGNLRIGRLSLANNCHIFVLIFGFFFLLAGIVLTVISYKVPLTTKAQTSSSREQGKVAGPAFIGIGSFLFIAGISLCLVYWRLNRAEAKRVRIFSVPDSQDNRSRSLTPTNASSFPSSRRESTFTSNYFSGRRKTLPSITQSIPEGFLAGGNNAFRGNGPNRISGDYLGDDRLNVLDPHSIREPSANSRRKSSLSRRPSLASPNFIKGMTPVDALMSTRSDEPFGSIVSLGGQKGRDIACFPSHNHGPKLPTTNTNMDNDERRLSSNSRDLPVITVNECVNPLIQTTDPLLKVNINGPTFQETSIV